MTVNEKQRRVRTAYCRPRPEQFDLFVLVLRVRQQFSLDAPAVAIDERAGLKRRAAKEHQKEGDAKAAKEEPHCDACHALLTCVASFRPRRFSHASPARSPCADH